MSAPTSADVTGDPSRPVPPAQPPDDDVSARYAPPRTSRATRRRRLVAAGGVAAVLAAFLWWAVEIVDRDVRWSTVSFTVDEVDTATVQFEVYGREGDVVRCLVRAASADFADVGQVEVDLGPLPPGGIATRSTTVRTIGPATSASVRTCAVLPDSLS